MPQAQPVPTNFVRPILKWAGGKGQLLAELRARLPESFEDYLEPFLGGGALFFDLADRLPGRAILGDLNPELVNFYEQVAQNVDQVIRHLQLLRNDEESFYQIRRAGWEQLSPSAAAARTIFLNRTCFNGLYRVNKQGDFNVPYGHGKNPSICNEEALHAASRVLQKATLLSADYKTLLRDHAKPGDLVFLDPPYLPVSAYADFKRYTKEQFFEEDHRELAVEVERLHELGCHVILTNSNHPLVHELYGRFKISIVPTRRYINTNGKKRTGEDVIITVPPRRTFVLQPMEQPLPAQVWKYPSTRFMGSKEKMLEHIASITSRIPCDTAVDLFSGSGIVGYLLKAQGKRVISNDYMAMSATFAKATIENNDVRLTDEDIEGALSSTPQKIDDFVQDTFRDVFFSDEDNATIDLLRANIAEVKSSKKQALLKAALIRACMKKQARGIFTYVGRRYDDGRKDMKMTIREHFAAAAKVFNGAIFDNGRENASRHGDAMDFSTADLHDALIYIDPPYYSPLSDNEYVRRYHFVEGIARNWEGVEIQEHSKVKKFKSYPTPFASRTGAKDAFDKVFRKFRQHTLLVSYSSNSLPTKEELTALMARYKKVVEVIEVDYRYHSGNHPHKVGSNKSQVQEYLFLGT